MFTVKELWKPVKPTEHTAVYMRINLIFHPENASQQTAHKQSTVYSECCRLHSHCGCTRGDNWMYNIHNTAVSWWNNSHSHNTAFRKYINFMVTCRLIQMWKWLQWQSVYCIAVNLTVFSSAGRANSILTGRKLSVYVCVNQGGLYHRDL